MALAKNVQPRDEIDDSLQENRHMKLEQDADFGVSSEEYEF